MKKINIAIDGYSSCGKGTLAKALAHHLNYLFIDSGAMYRAVTYAILSNKIDVDGSVEIEKLLPQLKIDFRYIEQINHYNILLNGEDVEDKIRGMEVSNNVSEVSKLDVVRAYLVEQQQLMGKDKGVVMDGRDIGTVVFPDAELKIFMTAAIEVRAHRRFNELIEKGVTDITFHQVLENITHRDDIDSNRTNSPLQAASDAVIIDNTDLSKQQQFEWALSLVNERLK